MIGVLCTVVVWFLISLVSIKVFLNVALPISIVMHRNERPFSYLFLIEVAPWILAIGFAWVGQLDGWLAYSSIAVFGFVAIVASYFFFLVSVIAALLSQGKKE